MLDCPPTLGMMTVNALAAADRVIVPVQPEYLSVVGMMQLFDKISLVKEQINPGLRVEGVLITLANMRTNLAKNTLNIIHNAYGGSVRIFKNPITYSTKVKEASAAGKSIFAYEPRGNAAYNRVREFVDNSTMAQGYKDLIYVYYNYLVGKVQNHHRIPSFTRMSQPNAPLYELTDNGGVLSVTLNDSNGVLGNYHFSANGISFSKNGSQLTASTGSAFSGEVMVTATHASAQRRGVICYGDGGGNIQDTAAIGSPIEDPIRAYFRLKVAVGHLNTALGRDAKTARALILGTISVITTMPKRICVTAPPRNSSALSAPSGARMVRDEHDSTFYRPH